MSFKVIDGGAAGGDEPPTQPPTTNASAARENMRVRLEAMVKECLDSGASVAMLVWEGKGSDNRSTELRALVTPGSQAVHRGLVELMWEQIHEVGE